MSECDELRQLAKDFVTALEPFANRLPASVWNEPYDRLTALLRDGTQSGEGERP